MVGAQIIMPNMCHTHQYVLVAQADYGPCDPWRSLIIAAQIALFQAATVDPLTHAKLDGDVSRIREVGCLACYKPQAFGSIVELATSRDLAVIKALGERWVKEARV
ncbi:MAG: hypothetical protein ACHQX3_06410 [Nitrospirales bacterium]|jgi:hypothetical protein